jgi:quercetin dioxygenase-like cupin family protein
LGKIKNRGNIMNKENLSVFATGEENPFGQYFIGKSYLNMLSLQQVVIGNVTFEPKCRNNWHIHHAEKGGGQILLVTAGEGWYQEWGKPARKLKAGDVVNIPANVKHWHGATADSWFVHIAIEVPAEGGKTEWCEQVTDEEYSKL